MNLLNTHDQDVPHDLSRIFLTSLSDLASSLPSAEEIETRFSSPEISLSTPENRPFSPENHRNDSFYFHNTSNPSFTLHSQQSPSYTQYPGRFLSRRSLSARYLRNKDYAGDPQRSASSGHLRTSDSVLPNFWNDSSQDLTPDPSQDLLVQQEREGRKERKI